MGISSPLAVSGGEGSSLHNGNMHNIEDFPLPRDQQPQPRHRAAATAAAAASFFLVLLLLLSFSSWLVLSFFFTYSYIRPSMKDIKYKLENILMGKIITF